MNLKDYIKNINEYLIAENFDEGSSEVMDNKVNQLQDLKTRFEAFLKKIEDLGLNLEEIIQTANAQSTTEENASAAPATNTETAAPVTPANPQPVQPQ